MATKKTARNTTKKPARALYRFHAYFGRWGDLFGLFTATADEVKKAVGRDCYFGEVLGKHSDVELKLDAEHFKKLTADPDFVRKFERYGCASGTNPLGVLADNDAENAGL